MNKVILMGRLTKDPEVRYTQNTNTLVASFSLAVNRRFAKQGEERQADFINVVAWTKTGEFCSKYFKKGQQVAVIGRIQTRTWDDEQGQKHYVTEVVAEEAIDADQMTGNLMKLWVKFCDMQDINESDAYIQLYRLMAKSLEKRGFKKDAEYYRKAIGE